MDIYHCNTILYNKIGKILEVLATRSIIEVLATRSIIEVLAQKSFFVI
jgi:hypothetical protein